MSGSPTKDYIIEVTGSGVALVDYDNDGLLDIYLVNGSTLDLVRQGRPAPRGSAARNAGGRTSPMSPARLAWQTSEWGQGVCTGDYDNDGFQDVYVTNFGRSRLCLEPGGPPLRGRGRERAGWPWTAGRPAAPSETTTATGCSICSWREYVTLDLENLPPAPNRPAGVSSGPTAAGDAGGVGMGASCTAGATVCTYRGHRVMAGPRGLKGAPRLFRNKGDGTFTEATKEAGVDDPSALCGFGVAWFDMDDDGKLDLLVANDSGPITSIAISARGGSATSATRRAPPSTGRTRAGPYGVAIGDYDNDGRDDVHITNFADDFNVLYTTRRISSSTT